MIKPLQLLAGQPAVVNIDDIFYCGDGEIKFAPGDVIGVQYDARNQLLTLQIPDSASGIYLLPFTVAGFAYHLPVVVEQQTWHTFRFRPQQEIEKAAVFGAFNSWNRNQLIMTDSDGDGEYSLKVPIEPGRYEYKFFIDGRELIDPDNPVKVPNPFGDFNSILEVKSPRPQQVQLHILELEIRAEKIAARFAAAIGETPVKLTDRNVISLLDNSELPQSAISVNGHEIEVTLDKKDLAGNHLFRVAATVDGNASSFFNARFVDGNPISGSDFVNWQDAILYAIMIDRFCDGDPSINAPVEHPELATKANFQGGDLQGILEKLREGYFSELGVNTLWLSPVNQNTDKAQREWPEPHRYFSAYHGYWPIDPQQVDPRFGNMELLKALVDEAHAQDMRVLLDFVANHVHEDHPYFRNNRGWFGELDPPDGKKNIRLWDEQRLTTWFEPFLPSFDYQGSERALEAMTDNAIWWLEETGVDGFRHDAVKHIPNKFWRTLTRKIKSRGLDRQIFQIGETFGSYSLIQSYVNNGQLDGQFNFNLFYTARATFLDPQSDFSILAAEMQKTASVYGSNHLMGNLIDSHDQIRFMALADNDLTLQSENGKELGWINPPQVDDTMSYRKSRLFQSFIMSIPGVPVVYYGNEIGMSGADDPDNRRMMRFGEDISAPEQNMLREVRAIVQLRRNHSALRHGNLKIIAADENCFAFMRSDFNERILVVINKSSRSQSLALQLPRFYELYLAKNLRNGHLSEVKNQLLSIRVPPLTANFYSLK